MKRGTTWVLVADAMCARVEENTPGAGLAEVPGAVVEGPSLRDREIVSDRPGRTFGPDGQGRHAMERDTDPARHEERQFVQEITGWLTLALRGDDFGRLTIVAAPRTLGNPRSALSATVEARIVRDLDKHLTRERSAAIVDAVRDWIRS